MEKKKLLLVAVSVGVFLVIVIGAALLVFTPRGSAVQTAVIVDRSLPPQEPARSVTVDSSGMIGSPELRNLQDPASVSPKQESSIYSGEGDSGRGTVISVPNPSVTAVPAAEAKPQIRQSQPVVQGSQKTPVPAKPAASAAPAKKTYHDFWVQAGSYSTRDRADTVKKTLGDKGIAAIITNQDISGQTYYRVRVGPYTSQNEADYWLSMIKSISGFEGSQIWESTSRR